MSSAGGEGDRGALQEPLRLADARAHGPVGVGVAVVVRRLVGEEDSASDRRGETIQVDAAMVRERVATLAASADLSRYIL